MTDIEMKKVARIMMTADGGCGHCVSNLLEMLVEAFPEHLATIDGVHYDQTLDDRP